MSNTRELEVSEWKGYFDTISQFVSDMEIEVAVIGPELGDQVEAEWQPFAGISYDPRSQRLDIMMELDGGAGDHAVIKPKAIYLVDEMDSMPALIEVIDADDNHFLLKFRDVEGEFIQPTGT
jgi:hypothetical protein